MKCNKGFTLIEIIISIAFLGIIAVAFLAAMSGQYAMLRRTREITNDAFAAQQKIEQDIQKVRKDIEDNTTPSGLSREITLFDDTHGGAYERKIKTYERITAIKPSESPLTTTRRYYTLISDDRADPIKTATVTGNQIEIKKGAAGLLTTYFDTASSRVASTITLSDPQNVHRMFVHRWFVAREGFYHPVPDSVTGLEMGGKYPRYPDDYVMLVNENFPDLLNSADKNKYKGFAGKHVIHAVASGSELGKLGEEKISNSVYFSGLPVTRSIALHLDASLVDEDDVATIGTNNYLSRWIDLSKEAGAKAQANDAIPQNINNKPLLREEITGKVLGLDGRAYDTYASYLRFDGTNRMVVENTATLNLNELTLFVVARATTQSAPRFIVGARERNDTDNNSWNIGFAEEKKLGFNFRMTNTSEDKVIASEQEGLDGDWHVLCAALTQGSEKNAAFSIDEAGTIEMERVTNGSIKGLISIGGDSRFGNTVADISEIILYSKELDAGEQNAVRAYLKQKYSPVSPLISLAELKSPARQTVYLHQTTSVELPDTLEGVMLDGSVRQISVEWVDGAVVTSSTARTIVKQARAIADPSKTATAEIAFVGIRSVESINNTVVQNTPYAMPAQVPVMMTNDSLLMMDVDWEGQTISTNTIGTKTAVGHLMDSEDVIAHLQVVVLPQVNILGVDGDRSYVEIRTNQSITFVEMRDDRDRLVTGITPSYSNGHKTVRLSKSSNYSNDEWYSVKIVSSDGVEKGIDVRRSGFIFYSWNYR